MLLTPNKGKAADKAQLGQHNGDRRLSDITSYTEGLWQPEVAVLSALAGAAIGAARGAVRITG